MENAIVLHKTKTSFWVNLTLNLEIAKWLKMFAVPSETYQNFFKLPFVQGALQRYQVKLIVFDPRQEEIRQWIR
ncbi:hypothetical protein H6G96_11635 [Nostoc sp. FACHB-892]|nr:hypothetical protein [Nostoc sp. FACHB-892]